MATPGTYHQCLLLHLLCLPQASHMAWMVKNMPAMQEVQVLSLAWEDPLEKGMAYPFQNSCLENSMDRGAWWATVQRSAKNQT